MMSSSTGVFTDYRLWALHTDYTTCIRSDDLHKISMTCVWVRRPAYRLHNHRLLAFLYES
jgi:hypothetical protein